MILVDYLSFIKQNDQISKKYIVQLLNPSYLISPSLYSFHIYNSKLRWNILYFESLVIIINSSMSDRKQQRNNRATMAKQAYLRQHIPANDYDDFGEFCEEVVGNTVIEGWSLEFVIQLVDKFKRKLSERKERELQQPPENKLFHIYQTGKNNQIRDLAEQIKQEESKKPQNQGKTKRPGSKAKQETALDVLDSIFKNQKPNQFNTNKMDKTQYQSRKFWQIPAIEDPKQKENQKQKSSFAKNNQTAQTTQFSSNKMPLEPQKFEKIFQTGLKIPQTKSQSNNTSPTVKNNNTNIFDKFTLADNDNKSNNSQLVNGNSQRNEIKLLSVKNINNSKIPYEGQILFPKSFRQFISCYKSFQRHALSLKDLKVNITDHEIISRRFFSSDYVMYHLRVTPSNIICKRNLEDFQKLRKNLEQVYPGIRLPYLEKIGLFGSQTSPEYIEKQKKYLAYFLQDLLSHDQLKNFRILEDFLTIKEHKLMKRKFEQYDKMKKIVSIEQLCLLEGAVKVEICENNRQYNEYLQLFNSKMKNSWTIQDRIFTQINDMHKRIADCYRQLAEEINKISKDVIEFNRRVNLNQIETLDTAFQGLIRYTNENIKIQQKQIDVLQNQFLARIRYEKQNMGTLDYVTTIRNDLTRCYLKRMDNQKSNDNLDYLSERLKDYKSSIIDESKNITVLKYQCGYINNLMMNQGHFYFTQLGKKIDKVVSNACYEKMQYLTKSMGLYSELMCA